MDKPRIARIETNVEAVLASYEKCGAGNCDGCAFEYIRRDWPAACAFYQQESAKYLLTAQNEVIKGLLKVGYPHGYEKEEPWIVDYMELLTEVIKKAVRLNNG